MFIKRFGVVSRETSTPLHHRRPGRSTSCRRRQPALAVGQQSRRPGRSTGRRRRQRGVAAHALGSAAAGRMQSQGVAVARASGQFGARRWRGGGASWAHLGRLSPWSRTTKNVASGAELARLRSLCSACHRSIFCSARPRRQTPQVLPGFGSASAPSRAMFRQCFACLHLRATVPPLHRPPAAPRPRRAAAPPAPRPEPPACPCHGSALTLHAASGRTAMGVRSNAPPAPAPPSWPTWPPVVQRGRRST